MNVNLHDLYIIIMQVMLTTYCIVSLEMTGGMAANSSVEKALEYCQYNCSDVDRNPPYLLLTVQSMEVL